RTEWALDDTVEKLAAAKYGLVTLGRNLRAQYNIPANRKVPFILRPAGDLPDAELRVMAFLLNAERLERADSTWSPERGTPVAANAIGELYLPLAGLIDVRAERARLTRELERVRAELKKVQEKLDNPAFTAKVPARVLEEHQQRKAAFKAQEAQVLAALDHLPEAAEQTQTPL